MTSAEIVVVYAAIIDGLSPAEIQALWMSALFGIALPAVSSPNAPELSALCAIASGSKVPRAPRFPHATTRRAHDARDERTTVLS